MLLPRLILIANGFTDPDTAAKVLLLAETGVPWVMLRDRQTDRVSFRDAAGELVARLRALPAPPHISITARMAVARELQTSLHLGKRDVARAEARRRLPESALVGFSAHSVDELAAETRGAGPGAGADVGADYTFLSPIFPTSTHPEHPALGIEKLREAVAAAHGVPVFALGGVTPARAAACREAGAYGVAVVSGLLEATDPVGAIEAYRRAVE